MSRAAEKSSRKGLSSSLSRGIDRVIETLAPVYGAKRMSARMTMAMAAEMFGSGGGFDGADRESREMGSWTPFPTDADSAVVLGLEDMRSRARDADRNQPIARGLVNTTIINVVGVGLTMQSRIDRDGLGLSDAAAEDWQRHTERRWHLWAGSRDCDLERKLTFNGHVQLALRSRCVNGEALILLPHVPLPHLSNPLRLQAVESDRLSNPDRKPDGSNLVGGIRKDRYGAAQSYHILRGHPGNVLFADPSRWLWDEYPAYHPQTGLPNVLHYFRTERPGQSRGFPMIAPVLEPLKDLSRMSKAELKRAVVSALFTVFLKGAGGKGMGNMPPGFGGPAMYPGGMSVATGAAEQSAATTGNIKLGYGSVVDLGDSGQEIQLADPKLPNVNFDPFFLANVRQIGMATGIPYEVVIKHYTASYSAAKAAMEDAYRYFLFERAGLVDDVCKVIYAVWMTQEVAQGTIYAPGFFADPMIRAAWLGSEWIGPKKPILDEEKAIDAAGKRVALGVSTEAQETAELNGGDWETNIKQRGREKRMRAAEGLDDPAPQAKRPTAAKPAPDPDLPEEEDKS